MPLYFTQGSIVASPGQQYSLSQWITVTPGNLPEYVVLTGLDRNEYVVTSTGAVGSLTGNYNVASFVANAQTNDDANIGIVFEYTDQGYFNASYGYLAGLSFAASTDNFRSEYLSLYAYGSAGVANAAQLSSLTALANSLTGNPSPQFFIAPPAGCTSLGSLDIVTRTGYVDATPNLATPNEIAAVAASFVGKPWGFNGCWVLASNIAAAAGASLPVNSSFTRSMAPPGANGEWFVAYDSSTATAAQQLTWQTQLRTGDIVDFDGYCGGHIVTVASGSGYGALMIDNAGIKANDGSLDDIIIESAHGPADAFSGALPQDIVIYRLDTPVITPLTTLAMAANGSSLIAGAFSARDPAGRQIVSYQIYDAAAGAFTIGGVRGSAHTSDSALTVSAASLPDATYNAGPSPGNASIMVRAFNGAYWGDWQDIGIQVGPTTQVPVLHVATDQTVVRAGEQVSLSELFTASSPDSPILSYTIHDPTGPITGSGHVSLNGAINLLGTPVDTTQDMTYQVSADDFAKLTYVGGGFVQNGEALSITAVNAAQQTSVAAALQIMNIGLAGSGIAHYLAPGTEIPVTEMFAVTGVSSDSPIKFYIFSLDPTLSDTLNLNGATNLFGSTLTNIDGWAHYEILAADLGKVTFTAGAYTGQYGNELLIAALDGLSTANAFSLKHVATAPAQITAKPTNLVLIGDTVPLSSLFVTTQDVTGLDFHIFDPQGGGLVNLNGVTNLMGKEALSGECVISGRDLGQVTYTGGSGEESLLIATSNDQHATWAPEVGIHVTGVVTALTAAGVSGQAQSTTIAVSDSAINIGANIDALGSLAALGRLANVTLTDAATPTLAITAAQFARDASGLAAITSGFALEVSALTADSSLTGLTGHATTVVFDAAAGRLANYNVIHTGSAYLVTDMVGAGGTDTLSNIQRLKFPDATIALTLDGINVGNGLASEYNAMAEKLYVAYFGRPADPLGLQSMTAQLSAARAPTGVQAFIASYSTNAAVKAIIDGFGNSAESARLYPGSNTDFVAAIFQNLFGRNPAGTFWIDALNNNQMTRSQAAMNILAGAETNTTAQGLIDAAGIVNKIVVADNFTTAIVTATGYSGSAAAATARALLHLVDQDTNVVSFQSSVDATLIGMGAEPVHVG